MSSERDPPANAGTASRRRPEASQRSPPARARPGPGPPPAAGRPLRQSPSLASCLGSVVAGRTASADSCVAARQGWATGPMPPRGAEEPGLRFGSGVAGGGADGTGGAGAGLARRPRRPWVPAGCVWVWVWVWRHRRLGPGRPEDPSVPLSSHQGRSSRRQGRGCRPRPPPPPTPVPSVAGRSSWMEASERLPSPGQLGAPCHPPWPWRPLLAGRGTDPGQGAAQSAGGFVPPSRRGAWASPLPRGSSRGRGAWWLPRVLPPRRTLLGLVASVLSRGPGRSPVPWPGLPRAHRHVPGHTDTRTQVWGVPLPTPVPPRT